MPVRVIGPRDKRDPDEIVVNTTSQSAEEWSKGLSPFFLGPIPLYDDAMAAVSQNMENAWQYAKVYAEHVDADGNPTPAYFAWAKEGWVKRKADRYPMGRGQKPLYSWWAGEKLPYLEARKRIYIPLYAHAVAKTDAFARLRQMYIDNGNRITLWDFDGRDHIALGMSIRDVVNDPTHSMGHAFVIAHLLEGSTP